MTAGETGSQKLPCGSSRITALGAAGWDPDVTRALYKDPVRDWERRGFAALRVLRPRGLTREAP